MKRHVLITLSAASLITACGSGGPDYTSLISEVEELGRSVRPCEVQWQGSDCRFAMRDAGSAASDIWQTLDDHQLSETEQARVVHSWAYDWLKWDSECGEAEKEDYISCAKGAPEEADVEPALSALRQLQRQE